MASAMGKNAVDFICEGQRNMMVGGDRNRVYTIPLQEVVQDSRVTDLSMYDMVGMLSI